ncbi:zinc ribbon domain-containing protein [Halobaculum lipolyticum]|uniref:Zinc ribbon domain-containing protein n=1 Tax=Halobaculum lipolyticum TaxID=3032001 RepID=A0ABD5WB21_9EURY|nr:zinc ribbon domain-containing protein [Halobaculum sp. DT31]
MPSGFADATGPSDCPDCGARIDPTDRFCSDCGARVSTGRASGRRGAPNAEDRAWLRRRVADLHAEGWETLSDDGERIVLRNRGFGRLPVHAVLFLLTGGIGNLLYAFYRYTSGAPRREVYADGTERSLSGGDGGVDLPTLVAATAAGVLLAAGAIWFGVTALTNVSLLLAVLGTLVFVLSALFAIMIPQFVRDGVRSPGTFGTERSVDRERVRNPAEPCAACGRRVFHGEHRRFAERFYVAGLPVRTTKSGENVYCAACADERNGPLDDDEIEAELARIRTETGRGGRGRDTDRDTERDREVESDPR